MTKFNYIGAPDTFKYIMVVTKQSGITKMEEIMSGAKEVIVGAVPNTSIQHAATFLRDVIEDPMGVSPADTAEGVMRRAEMMTWVKELPEKEQTVIVSRFGLDGSEARTLEEIGRDMGLTRERVRQIEMAALIIRLKADRFFVRVDRFLPFAQAAISESEIVVRGRPVRL